MLQNKVLVFCLPLLLSPQPDMLTALPAQFSKRFSTEQITCCIVQPQTGHEKVKLSFIDVLYGTRK